MSPSTAHWQHFVFTPAYTAPVTQTILTVAQSCPVTALPILSPLPGVHVSAACKMSGRKSNRRCSATDNHHLPVRNQWSHD